VHLDYRTQLHPRIRAQLNELNHELPNPSTGEIRQQIAVEINEAGAEELYEFIHTRAEQAAHETRKALLGYAVLPTVVLHAAVEQFEDALIRSGHAERDFGRLARSYRSELWPGRYEGLGSGHVRFAAVQRACDALARAVGGQDDDSTADGPRLEAGE
jgi:hypothetical protein